MKAAFLSYFMQQKKYVKDPVEIHNIKQRDGETLEDFMERFKIETGRMKEAPECMRISGFMHEINNPELTKRLNEHVPKTMEEMMIATTAFIRGKAAAASKKKGHDDYITDEVQQRDYMAARTTETPGDHRRHHPFYQSIDELHDCQVVITLQRYHRTTGAKSDTSGTIYGSRNAKIPDQKGDRNNLQLSIGIC
nr:reverse transcriptase domain-containing protein [Tanacetum cinerariifolium]